MLYFINEKSECTGCGTCAAVCPVNCISLKYDEEGFIYPIPDKNCINCGKCERVCPNIIKDKDFFEEKFSQYCVVGRHINNYIWEQSASGGAFTAICEAYCEENDGIFGAKFEGLKVVHDCVYSAEDIGCFRKSKYVQSEMKDCYKKIEVLLKSNKKVLFSGVPCQVAGVRSYLGEKYENLLCVDLICHGVGSPGIFRRYVEFLEKKYCAKLSSFSFRNKKLKMGRLLEYIVTIELENGVIIDEKENIYNNGFLQALFLRPSCGECKFTNLNRVGDITIGDFKKKHELLPKLKGLDNFSTIIINSKKGSDVFNNAKKYMEVYTIKMEDILKTNSPLRLASVMNINREIFFDDLKMGKPIEQVLQEYIISPDLIKRVWLLIPDRIRAWIKRMIV